MDLFVCSCGRELIGGTARLASDATAAQGGGMGMESRKCKVVEEPGMALVQGLVVLGTLGAITQA